MELPLTRLWARSRVRRPYCTSDRYRGWRRKTFRLSSLDLTPRVNVNHWPVYSNWESFINISAIDLLEKMLEVDADKRITAAQTLSHPYLEEVSQHYDIGHQGRFKNDEIFFSFFKKNLLLCSMPTLRMNPLPLSMTKLLKTTNSLWRFGKVRSHEKLCSKIYCNCLEKVWTTIKAFREEMFRESFTN